MKDEEKDTLSLGLNNFFQVGKQEENGEWVKCCEISGYLCDWEGPSKRFNYHFVKDCLFGIEKNIFNKNEKVMQLFKKDRQTKTLDLADMPDIDIEAALNALDSTRLKLEGKELEKELLFLNKILEENEKHISTKYHAHSKKKVRYSKTEAIPLTQPYKDEFRGVLKEKTAGEGVDYEPSFYLNIFLYRNYAEVEDGKEEGVFTFSREGAEHKMSFCVESLDRYVEIGLFDFGDFLFSEYSMDMQGVERYSVSSEGLRGLTGDLKLGEKSVCSVEYMADLKRGQISVGDTKISISTNNQACNTIFILIKGPKSKISYKELG